MANVLTVYIGTTNYGATSGSVSGEGAVQQIEVIPAQSGSIGKATIKLRRTSGGAYTIPSRAEVKISLVNDATNVSSVVYFHGFVVNTKRRRIKGTTLWEAVVECNDINVLLDWCRVAIDRAGINSSGATTFGTQLLRIYRWALLNATSGTPDITVDTTYIAHYSNAATAFNAMKGSLRELTQMVCNNYNAANPAVYPKFYLKAVPNAVTPPTAGFHSAVVLAEYDGAAGVLATDPVAAHFSDAAPGDGNTSISSFDRTLDGADLATRVVAVGRRNSPDDYAYQALADNSTRTAYPNPYDDRDISGTVQNAWEGPPIRVPDGYSTAQIQGYAAQALADLQNPRETLEITSFDVSESDPVLPGEVVQVTWAHEGLSGTRYRVAEVRNKWIMAGGSPGYEFVQTIVAGNVLRRLGDDQRPGTSRVVERDTTAPDPPTDLAIVQYDSGKDDYEAPDPGLRRINLTWTPSPSSDACEQRLAALYGSMWVPLATIHNNTQAAASVLVFPNRSGTIYLYAVDGHGNVSQPATVAFQSNPPNPSPALLNPTFAMRMFDNPAQPEYWEITDVGSPDYGVEETKQFGGTHAFRITLANNPDSVTLLSPPVMCLDPTTATIQSAFALAVRAMYYSSHARNQISITLRYYNSADVNFSSTAFLTNGTPAATTNTIVAPGPQVPPAGSKYARLELKYTWGGTTGGADLLFGGCLLQEAVTGRTIKGSSVGSPPLTDNQQLSNPIFAEPDYLDVTQPASWTIEAEDTNAYGLVATGIDLAGTGGTALELHADNSETVIYASERVSIPNPTVGGDYVSWRVMHVADDEILGGFDVFLRYYDSAGLGLGSPVTVRDGATQPTVLTPGETLQGFDLGPDGAVEVDMVLQLTSTVPITVYVSGLRLQLATTASAIATRWEPLSWDNSIVFFNSDIVMTEVPV